MPVFKLREAVKDVLSVDTHQQKLTVRDIVLEDWDEAGAMMMIIRYPKFHDGVTVYLVQLVEGIHVKVHVPDDNKEGVMHTFIVQNQANINHFSLPRYINIHVPSRFQQKTLFNIMRYVTGLSFLDSISSTCIYCQSTGRKTIVSDEPVSSIEWITNGCTLSLTPQPQILNAGSRWCMQLPSVTSQQFSFTA